VDHHDRQQGQVRNGDPDDHIVTWRLTPQIATTCQQEQPNSEKCLSNVYLVSP
jgi:hypothetical protein